jgi:hypothetical protein
MVPAQPPAAGLAITNARRVVGELGGPRPDGPILPGDVVTLAFDVDGITLNADGIANYTLAMETVDKAGKVLFKDAPAARQDYVPLGGRRIPARAFVMVGLQQPAGDYTLRVTVTDVASKATARTEHKYTVLPPGFGVVGVNTSYDDGNRLSAPTSGTVGQAVWLHFGVVGFQRDPKTKQPKITAEMTITDEKGQPTLAKPTSVTLDAGVAEADTTFFLRFYLYMTRPGKFTVTLKVTDALGGKSATYTLPLTVLPSAN